MRIIILGSTGYLGSRLAHRFAAWPDADVVCVHRAASKLDALQDIADRVTFVTSDYPSLQACISDSAQASCIVNASCSYLRGATSEQIIESNLLFPLRALNMAAQRGQTDGVRTRFVSVGTGLPDAFNIYTYSKKQLNDMGRYLAGMGGVQFINVELENYYGPQEPGDRFLPTCMRKMAAGEPLLLTSGDQKRDFVYIDDVLDAFALIVRHERLPNYFDVPVGSGEAPSIRELITYLAAQMHTASELRFGAVTARQNEPSCCADMSAYAMMGGTVRWPWQRGIVKLLQKEGYIT